MERERRKKGNRSRRRLAYAVVPLFLLFLCIVMPSFDMHRMVSVQNDTSTTIKVRLKGEMKMVAQREYLLLPGNNWNVPPNSTNTLPYYLSRKGIEDLPFVEIQCTFPNGESLSLRTTHEDWQAYHRKHGSPGWMRVIVTGHEISLK